MADAQDLVSSATCTAFLAAGGVTPTAAQTAVLGTLITDASRLICRFARRYFALTTYDQVKTPLAGQTDKGEPDALFLDFAPLQSVSRVATDATAALSVSNTSAANARATVAYTFTGDPEISVVRTGLTLVRVASGVTTTAGLLFADYATVQSLADAVTALGNGWTATVGANLGGWASADLYGPLAPQGAKSSGVTLSVFQTDVNGFDVDARKGVVYLPDRLAGFGSGPGGWWMWPTSADATLGAAGWRAPVRVTYDGGWSTVPEPVQRACVEVVKLTLDRLNTDSALKSESAKSYSYAVRDAWDALPPQVRQTVLAYREAT